MIKIGYSLVSTIEPGILASYALAGDGAQFNVVFPNSDGEQEALWVAPGWSNDTHALVERWLDDPGAPSRWHSALGDSETFDGEKVIVTRSYAADPDITPQAITKLQLRTALLALGLWSQFKAALAADPDAQEVWDIAADVNRGHDMVAQFATAFGLSDAQVDNLFRQAVT